MAIIVRPDRLTHVLERHTANGSMNKNASLFLDGEDIAALIQAAEAVAFTGMPRNRRQRVVDAGRSIGIDVRSGQATSLYTVITDAQDVMMTAFPGLL